MHGPSVHRTGSKQSPNLHRLLHHGLTPHVLEHFLDVFQCKHNYDGKHNWDREFPETNQRGKPVSRSLSVSRSGTPTMHQNAYLRSRTSGSSSQNSP